MHSSLKVAIIDNVPWGPLLLHHEFKFIAVASFQAFFFVLILRFQNNVLEKL